jgi:hypothetical protein
MRVAVVILSLLVGCSRPASEPPERSRQERAIEPERIRVPTVTGLRPASAPGTGAPRTPLAAHEGSIEIVMPHDTSVGVATTGRIRVLPGAGFHINTRYPFSVSLANAEGLAVAKANLAGGKGGIAGDAEILAETELSIPITVTPTAVGDHALRGSIDFGICKSDVCLTRAMPVSFTVVATR